MTRGGPALRAEGLTVAYGDVIALDDVTLAVPAGTRVAVLGPNGSGKSTLFQAAVGLVRPRAGRLVVDARSVAYVPQQLSLPPAFPLTVRDAVAMGRWGALGLWRRPGARDRRLVEEALEALDLGAVADRRIGDLSGGQRQRALLAQAAAQDAELLLLDEPLTGVDAPTADAVRGLVDAWHRDGRTVLVATHDLERSGRDYDLVLALNRRVVAFGPASEACTPDVLSATFGGRFAAVGDAVLDLDRHHHH